MKQLKTGKKNTWSRPNNIEDGPFYDGRQCHVHIYKKGYKIKNLSSIEDPFDENFSNKRVTNFNKFYCSICHQLKPNQPEVDKNAKKEQVRCPVVRQTSSYPKIKYQTSKKRKFVKDPKYQRNYSWLKPFDRIEKCNYITIEKSK